jgi:hypothetical protein
MKALVKRVAVVFILLVLTCSGVWAQASPPVQTQDEGNQFALAINFSAFYLSDSDTVDLFGNPWTGIGLVQVDTDTSRKWRSVYDLSIIGHKATGKVRLYALTYGVGKVMDGNDQVRPYVAFRVGPYIGDVEVDPLGIDRTNLGLNANAALGVVLYKRVFLEARYDYYSEFGGFNFNGFSATAGVVVATVTL